MMIFFFCYSVVMEWTDVVQLPLVSLVEIFVSLEVIVVIVQVVNLLSHHLKEKFVFTIVLIQLSTLPSSSDESKPMIFKDDFFLFFFCCDGMD